MKTVTPAEARPRFTAQAGSQWPDAWLRIDQMVYQQLGLLAAPFDLLGSVLDVLVQSTVQ